MILRHKQEDDYYEPKRASNFWNNNYIDMNIMVIEIKNLNKIKPYLRDIIIDLQESDTWEIQLTIAINIIYSKDVDKEQVKHSRSNNVELMIMQIIWLINISRPFFQDIKAV